MKIKDFVRQLMDEELKPIGLYEFIKAVKREAVFLALEKMNGNHSAAAKLLKITPQNIRTHVWEDGIKFEKKGSIDSFDPFQKPTKEVQK